MKPSDIFLAIMVSIFWGVNYLAIKVGVMHFPPIFMMALRFIIVAIVLFPAIFHVPKEKWFELFLLSVVMGVIYFSVLFTGVRYVPAGESAILTQLQVPMSVLMSSIFLKEVLTLRVLMGIVVASLGVMVTVGLPERGGSMFGVILLLIASVVWAITSLQIKLLGKISPHQINGAIALMAIPPLLIASFFLENGQWQSLETATWPSISGLFYTAIISTVVCYGLWFKLMQKYPMNKVVPFSLLVPVFAVLSAHLMAAEALIPHIIIGGLICIGGLALVVVKK